MSYAQRMKRSTATKVKHPDVAGNARAALARAKVYGVDLSRKYGGSVAYWSRRLNGETPMSIDDLYVIAEATGVPASSLVTDWLPRLDSNQQPSDYRSPIAA